MPHERRSTLDSLTAEQEEFLAGTPSPDKNNSQQPPARSLNLAPPMQQIRHRTRKTSTSETKQPENTQPVVSGRPQAVRSITVRLRPETAQALRKACAQRGIDYIEPFTQQDIVEYALVEWLSSNGFSVGNE